MTPAREGRSRVPGGRVPPAAEGVPSEVLVTRGLRSRRASLLEEAEVRNLGVEPFPRGRTRNVGPLAEGEKGRVPRVSG